LIAAIIAGVEVMFRIGAATLHSPEHIGFHAPGMTGPFGSAAACASLMGLSARQTAHAFGIAGSLAGGLLAFAKAGSGGMVKRLRNLMTTGRFGAGDIHAIAIEASGKVLSHHNERAPADIMLAQYSVPFCVAIATFHDPLDPAVFSDEVARDPRVRALAKAI